MARKNRFKDAKAGRESGGFAALPHAVVRSQAMAKLRPYAVKLLVELIGQYRGDNNGDLCATWSLMQARGFRSKQTLSGALAELVDSGFLLVARRGGRHTASLYALSFYRIDWCGGKLDIEATASPTGEWRKNEPLPPMPKIKIAAPTIGAMTQ